MLIDIAAVLEHPPGNLGKRCGDPGVRAGQPAITELGRNRQWGKCADGRHAGLIAHNLGLAAELRKVAR